MKRICKGKWRMLGGEVNYKSAKHKVVLISGGGTGIGRATALLYAAKGATVVLMGRRRREIDNLAQWINKKGGTALAVSGDIAKLSDVKKAIEATVSQFKRIDVLVNNAGIAAEAALVHETTDEMWQEIIDINLTGSFLLCREVLPVFIRQRSGVIVNVSSISALVGMPYMSAYSISKSGVIALTRSIAAEYARLGIRCNCICPGTVETPMTIAYLSKKDRYRQCAEAIPMGRIANAKEIARSIYYLGSEESSYLTGAVLTADGGYTAM
jgi:NAD(P)-dependent dehydrogenase (short-subunit alcohol dehydrogenase family)